MIFINSILNKATCIALILSVALVPTTSFSRGTTGSFADLAERLSPAVVNISTTQTVKSPFGSRSPFGNLPEGHPFERFNDLFNDFMPSQRDKRKATSLGSGFIISSDGYIATNRHVVANAEEITITLSNDEKYEVEIVGGDKKTDLAVLKVKDKLKKKLPFVNFGDSDKSRVGDWVLVIGNPFGLGGTVTAGIISARSRDIRSGPFDDFIQTDAAINRGNSGGPMFNMNGEVIGVNTAIISPNGGGNVGIGFAVPSSMAKNIIEQLKSGKVVQRGWLGVKIQALTDEIAESLGLEEPKGALVSEVTKDSPAEKGGIKSGDIILQFDGKEISIMRRLPKIVAETSVGKEVDVIILRDGKEKTLKISVAKLDGDESEISSTDKGKSNDEENLILGITLSPITSELRKKYKIAKDSKGIIITNIKRNSEAAQRGLRKGDLIMRVQLSDINSVEELKKEIKKRKENKGKQILLFIQRDNNRFFQALAVEEDNK